MQKQWLLKSSGLSIEDRLAEECNVSPLITRILHARQIQDPEAILKFLKPSLAHLPEPLEMEGMPRTVERLIRAVREKELITVYGDYDVDGTTATALLVDFFQNIQSPVQPYIPNRMKEGYSLNPEALRQIHAQGSRLVITVDNGISAIAEAELAKELGMDLIITDHHDLAATLPSAYAILNPKQSGPEAFGRELAGVGIAFYLLMALRRGLREAGLLPEVEPNLRQALDLVALGTIADMAPLTGINRILVAEGLKVLSRSPRLGVKALMDISGIDGPVRSDQVAFQLGPRINAVGRLEDASIGLKLLLCQNAQEAKALAETLNAANLSRKEIEDQIVESAVEKIETTQLAQQRRSLVVMDSSWHPGVVGIVASRLVEKYYLPSIVLSRDKGQLKGSARSIRGFHLVDALKKCSDLLLRFGGHAYAAGLTLEEDQLPAFIERFDQIVRDTLKDQDFVPSLMIDVESQLETINSDLLAQLEMLQPCGLGNPSPLLMLRSVEVRESRLVGERHLRMKVGDARQNFNAIAFRLAPKQPSVTARVDLAFIPEWNEWNGNRDIQLRVLDLRIS